MIKVCVVNPNFYRSSGVTTAVKRVYESFNGQEIDWFFVSCGHGTGAEIDTPLWVNKEKYSEIKLMVLSPYLVLSLFKLRFFLVKNKIQIVHVHHRRLLALVKISLIGIKIPVVYTGHLTYKNNVFFKIFNVDFAVAISDSVFENIKSTTKWKNISIIPNIAYFDYDIADFNDKYVKTVLCLARLESVKNHETLIKAWERINPIKNGYKLILVGEGTLRCKLETLVHDMNLSETISFLGYSNQVPTLIKKSLFLVLPSWVEGHPMVLIEGAACGRATLVTNVDGSKDSIPPLAQLPNKVDPKSVEELAYALKEWLNNPEKVIEEGKIFNSYWKGLASPEVVVLKYIDLYKSLII